MNQLINDTGNSFFLMPFFKKKRVESIEDKLVNLNLMMQKILKLNISNISQSYNT